MGNRQKYKAPSIRRMTGWLSTPKGLILQLDDGSLLFPRDEACGYPPKKRTEEAGVDWQGLHESFS